MDIMGNVEFTPIWEIYGLKSNPFTVFPLPVVGGNLPIEKAFFGREDEIRRLKNNFRSGESRTLVSGEPGVGKTSFVNCVRSHAVSNRFFTNFKEIDVQPGWKKEQFIINSLVAIHTTINLLGLNDKLATISKKLEALFTIVNSVDNSFSVSLAGTGLGYGSSQTISRPEMSETYLNQLFAETITELVNAGYTGVILHYNNLSVNESEGFSEREIETLFNSIRDVLLTEKVHFVFVSDLNVPQVLEGQPRVASVMTGAPILLDPMSFEEVKKIIHTRFDLLREEKLRFTSPVSDDAVKLLYDLYEGNIRYILNSLCEGLMALHSEDTPLTMSEENLGTILHKIAEKRFLAKLTGREKDVLLAMLEGVEGTNKSMAEKTGLKNQNISTYLKKLQGRGCIYLHHVKGTSKYYRVSEYTKWLLLPVSKNQGKRKGSLAEWL